jgi:AraC-like DNA-binding protein
MPQRAFINRGCASVFPINYALNPGMLLHILGQQLYCLGHDFLRHLIDINRTLNTSYEQMTRPDQRQGKAIATLRIGATMGVPDVLESLGMDPAEVLAEVGLGLELFDDPNNRIAFTARGRMLEHCAKRTGCPHFGLLVGQKAGLSSFGLVGLLAKYSPDVGSALKSLMRFMHLHVRGATTTLVIGPELAELEYQIYQSGARGNDQVGAGAVAVAHNILCDLCGNDFKPIEARFAHREPENLESFRKFFKAPLRFNCEQYAVVFSVKWLDRPLGESSSELLHLLRKEIDRLELGSADDFVQQVRALLRITLVTGHASADRVADLLSMHRRTLNRHLNAHGISFRKLVDEVSFEISRQLLKDTDMEIIQIASVLGYSNASSFTRAFRHWSSKTPARWRIEAKDGSVAQRAKRSAWQGLLREDS